MSETSQPLSTRELFDRYVVPTYGRFDLEISRGKGCHVWDTQGRRYLDFGAGIAVCSLGHAHHAVTEAIARQASQLVHTSNLYYTRPQGELACRLVNLIGEPGKVFFCNSGAEANEGLYKLARRYGNEDGRHEIITFQGSFHGRTLAGIAATGQEKVRIGFDPVTPGFRYARFNDAASAAALVNERTAAILVEPVQGEGGIHIATPDFLIALRTLCDEHGLLLLFDEIQCGLGRTGDWCGWKSIAGDRVMPDAVSWAKGIANGVPLGAFWVRDRAIAGGGRLCDILSAGSHGTTYGGNPLSCAAGLAVLNTIEQENLLHNALEVGAYLREEIRAIASPLISEVRAIGLMLGIQLSSDITQRCAIPQGKTPAAFLVTRLLAEGMLVIPAGESTLRLLPPLNITRDDAAECVAILKRTLAALPTP